METDYGAPIAFPVVAVVIPAFKVSKYILEVVNNIGPEVKHIIIVDDHCPEFSGHYVKQNSSDTRIEVIFNDENTGVGGAVKRGYERALQLDCDIVVKVDGDGQMDPAKIQSLILPITKGLADYTKGNRFFDIQSIKRMPLLRIIGNTVLSVFAKFSTGYWSIFDPNNGFTAISRRTLERLPLSKIDSGYFFESDMLFRLNLIDSVIVDVNLPSIYNGEESNLKLVPVLVWFPYKHLRNFIKRVGYTYYLKGSNLASIVLPLGLILFFAGLIRSATAWAHSISSGIPTPTGTVVLSAVLLLSGLQFLLSFISIDTSSEPRNRYK